jgi:hypothetical protein
MALDADVYGIELVTMSGRQTVDVRLGQRPPGVRPVERGVVIRPIMARRRTRRSDPRTDVWGIETPVAFGETDPIMRVLAGRRIVELGFG